MPDQSSLTIRERENRTVLRYHRVDKPEVSRDPPQVRKDAASHNDYHDPARPCLADCGFDVGVQYTIPCDGSIVIKRQNLEFHKVGL